MKPPMSIDWKRKASPATHSTLAVQRAAPRSHIAAMSTALPSTVMPATSAIAQRITPVTTKRSSPPSTKPSSSPERLGAAISSRRAKPLS